MDVADLREREFLLNYKQSIIRAVRDVDTANAAYAAEGDRLRKLNEAVLARQQTFSTPSARNTLWRTSMQLPNRPQPTNS